MADPLQKPDSVSHTKLEDNAIYYDVSPTTVCCVRFFGVIVFLMVCISFILALVKGTDNPSFYLLACNVIISSFVAVVLSWWYRSGDLLADKYWFLILVGSVIVLQCITTDVYVFHVIPEPQDQTTTPFINWTSIMTTLNHTTNKTFQEFHTKPTTLTPLPTELTTVDNSGF